MAKTSEGILPEMKVFKLFISRKQIKLENLLRLYLTYSFYLLASPFYLKRSNHLQIQRFELKRTFQKKTWLPQKIACGLASICSIFWQLFHVRQSFPNKETAFTPSSYFEVVIIVTNLLVKIT